ncbi:hypothetical protein MNBD_NITROSPINAE04-1682 [hydrothermal vent metagenome]|uniref:Response regulatory domain-containing protein n=1 Tax=hydrothermal vent metagenome TaxID=652676 RepID=A0A3B1BMC2_9ZZZZ
MSRTKILVADDSATIQKVFELAFENEDIEVVLTSDGKEALEMIHSVSPSMVIADVNMPGLDGFELCRTLKNDERSASIPVYLISSALDDFDELRSEEVGAAGRFEKPFRSEDMVTRVKAVIAEIQSGAPIAPDDEIGGDMMEAIEDISVGGGEEPETEGAQEDTFDDIDISLDSLLDSVEHRIDSPVDEDSVIVAEDDALNIDDELVVIEEENQGEPEILELDSSLLVSTDADSDEMDEENLEVEIISGPGQADDEAAIEEIAQDEMEPDMAVSAVLENEIMGDHQPEPGIREQKPDIDDIETETDIEPLEENGISAEGRRLLEAIDDDLEIGQTQTEKELLASGRIKDGSAPAQGGGDKEMIMEMARAAFEEFADSGGFHTLINEAIERFVKEMLTKEEFEEAVSKGIIDAISEMKPQILDDFREIAQEMTLNVAEDLVKKTIDQIKIEQ